MAVEALLIRDLAIVAIAAAATSLLFQRFNQPAVLGYLVAGVLIGPHVLHGGLVGDAASIRVLAELGTVFLIFGLGLSFRLSELKRVGGVAVTAGVLEVALMVGVGLLAARVFGWSTLDALFLGAILAISGATIIIKVLESLGRAHASTTPVVYGILIVEKIVAVILIAILSAIAITGGFALDALGEVAVRLVIFLLVALVLGLLLVPRIVDHLATSRVRETLVIAVVGIVFGIAIVAKTLGLSLALGAFVAGAVMAEARSREIVEARITPLRDLFIAIFFVAMGILVDPGDVVTHIVPILVLSAIVILGKIATVGVSCFAAGYPARQAFDVGISMGILGGFALVIANLGEELGVTAPFLFPVIASVVAVTTFVSPLLIRRSAAIVEATATRVPATVRSYARLYTERVNRLRASNIATGVTQVGVRDVVRVVAFGALLVALLVAAAFMDGLLKNTYTNGGALGSIARAGVWLPATLLALPVAWGLAHSVRRLVDDLVAVLFPESILATGPGATAAKVLRGSMLAFAAIAAGTVILAPSAIALPPLPFLGVFVLVVAVATYHFRASFRAMNRELESTVDAIVASDDSPQRDAMLDVIRERYRHDAALESVVVPSYSFVANHSIREVDIPHRTGALLVAHERGGQRTVNPPPDLVLQPGDVLGILGTPEEVAATRRILAEEPPRLQPPRRGNGEIRVEEVRVGEKSPVAGVPLEESRIRELTGATVMALVRGADSIPSPAPATMLRPDDILVCLGDAEQVAAARALIEGSG